MTEFEIDDASSGAATRLAERIPLTHFPARNSVRDFVKWKALESPSARGEPAPHDELGRIRHEHVFLFAGPCCYAVREDDEPPPRGDAALYLRGTCEMPGTGEAIPFDTGALGASSWPGVLQPFCCGTEAERLEFIREHSTDVGSWRSQFAKWLQHCYEDDPRKYLEATGNPKTDGEPRRTVPPELLAHNGCYGAAPCADRRAWTWEIRLRTVVGWEHVALLHVTSDGAEEADTLTKRESHLAHVKVHPLPNDAPTPPAMAFYKHAGDAFRELGVT
jgi:hypothetical protein